MKNVVWIVGVAAILAIGYAVFFVEKDSVPVTTLETADPVIVESEAPEAEAAMSAATEAVEDVVSDVKTEVGAAVDTAAEVAEENVEAAVEAATEAASDVVNGAGDALEDAGSNVLNSLTGN